MDVQVNGTRMCQERRRVEKSRPNPDATRQKDKYSPVKNLREGTSLRCTSSSVKLGNRA